MLQNKLIASVVGLAIATFSTVAVA